MSYISKPIYITPSVDKSQTVIQVFIVVVEKSLKLCPKSKDMILHEERDSEGLFPAERQRFLEKPVNYNPGTDACPAWLLYPTNAVCSEKKNETAAPRTVVL